MTKEEIRKAGEVMIAYSKGVMIQRKAKKSTERWTIISDPEFDWCRYEYRAIDMSNYRPFKDGEECLETMLKHTEFTRVCSLDTGINHSLTIIGNAIFFDLDIRVRYTFQELLNKVQFVDGTPFGIKQEE